MRNLRTEDEIIANWKGDIDKPVVSICCITYNHEPYIEDALEGFLIQETDFPFEILIHDDASTDRTADIIREYEAKYPRLIKPIYQTENQYSKTIHQSINGRFNISRAIGEYLMFCEGDDYWISKNKLDRQLKVLYKKKVDFVFHLTTYKSKNSERYHQCYKESGYISLKQHLSKGPSCSPLSSILIKKENLIAFEEKIPGFTKDRLTHAFIQYCGFIDTDAYYLNEMLSVYRVNVPDSWSDRVSKSKKLLVENTIRHLNTLTLLRDKVFIDKKWIVNSRRYRVVASLVLRKKISFKDKIKLIMLVAK